MSRKAARFTEADINRAGKVAKKLGMCVELLTDGTIRVAPMPAPRPEPEPVDDERVTVV